MYRGVLRVREKRYIMYTRLCILCLRLDDNAATTIRLYKRTTRAIRRVYKVFRLVCVRAYVSETSNTSMGEESRYSERGG